MLTVDAPFGTSEVPEVHLQRSPLMKVIAQLQFPRLSSLASSPAAAHRFSELMAASYPIISSGPSLVLVVTGASVTQQTSEGASTVWQLEDADGDWKVSFSDTSLALETTSYTTRQAFCAKLEVAVRSFTEVVDLPYISRLGVRYINRVTRPDEVEDLPRFFREPLSSLYAATRYNEDVRIHQSLSQIIYQVGSDEGLAARWGLLPPNGVTDPDMTPVDCTSFILDIDAFRESSRHSTKKDPAGIKADAYHLATRAHRYFRWAITEDFLRHSGGSIDA